MAAESQQESGEWLTCSRAKQLKPGQRVRMMWPRQDALTSPKQKPFPQFYRWVYGRILDGLAAVRLDDGGLTPRVSFSRMERWVEKKGGE